VIKDAIETLSKGKDLDAKQVSSSFYEIMGGKASAHDMEQFLVLLAKKGETISEITAAVKVMRDKMDRLEPKGDMMLDTCGTGGGSSSFNVSTLVALIVAATGIKVAKHGNRSYTSHCGSADILERLGVKISIDKSRAIECINRVGMAFLFAPLYHSAMKHVIDVRRKLKTRTIFNLLGPLSNPADANVQVIGVFQRELTETLAKVLKNLNTKRAFVVHGLDGFDEVSISDKTRVSELKEGRVTTYEVTPEDFGAKRYSKESVACRTIDENIEAFKSILDGQESAKMAMALVNASMALVAAGKAGSLKAGYTLAKEIIDSKKAKKVLEDLVKFTNG